MAAISLSFSSSIVSSPISRARPNPNPMTKDPIFRVSCNSTSAAASKTASVSSRHWKEGEFPGISETSFSGNTRKTPTKKNSVEKKKKNNAKAWAHNLPEALSFRIHKKHWLKSLEFFDMLREQPYYEPQEETYMKLIVLLGKCGQPHRARQLFNCIKEDGCESTQLYTALLAAYCKNSQVDQAVLTLDEMKKLPGCQPDVFTYSTLIKACVDALQFELSEFLYEEMAKRSIAPNIATQNIVLSGYVKAGKLDQMEKMLSSMIESTSCKPDVSTMNSVIYVFGDKGQINMMEEWYEKFRNFGIQPQTRTFNILIGAYGKKRMYDEMSSVMQYMRKLKCPWTTATYNNVIEAFAAVGDATNMEYTFDQMRAEGRKPDVNTFCCLINGYANAGIFHKVIGCVRLAGRFQIPENTSFYNAVISACVKAEDLMEMERIFKRMKDKQCQPDETTYSVMVEAYRKEGMNDKIYYLEQEKQMMLTDEKKLSNSEDKLLD